METTIEEILNPQTRKKRYASSPRKLIHTCKGFPYPLLPVPAKRSRKQVFPPLNTACLVLSFFIEPHLTDKERAAAFGMTPRQIAAARKHVFDRRDALTPAPLDIAYFVFQIYTTRRHVREIAREIGLSRAGAQYIFSKCAGANAFPRRKQYTPPPAFFSESRCYNPLFRLAAAAAKIATTRHLSEIAEILGMKEYSVRRNILPIRDKTRLAIIANI